MRNDVVLVSKFGFKFENGKCVGWDLCFEVICMVVEGMLKCLCIDCIDLLYLYRVDLNVLVEEVVGVVGELIKEGKVCYFGLFEVLLIMLCKVYVEYLVIVV